MIEELQRSRDLGGENGFNRDDDDELVENVITDVQPQLL
jgi:hypothetical protein